MSKFHFPCRPVSSRIAFGPRFAPTMVRRFAANEAIVVFRHWYVMVPPGPRFRVVGEPPLELVMNSRTTPVPSAGAPDEDCGFHPGSSDPSASFIFGFLPPTSAQAGI